MVEELANFWPLALMIIEMHENLRRTRQKVKLMKYISYISYQIVFNCVKRKEIKQLATFGQILVSSSLFILSRMVMVSPPSCLYMPDQSFDREQQSSPSNPTISMSMPHASSIAYLLIIVGIQLSPVFSKRCLLSI